MVGSKWGLADGSDAHDYQAAEQNEAGGDCEQQSVVFLASGGTDG
jgi:hypothetical protein